MGNTKFKIKKTILIALVILACLFAGLGVKALTANEVSAAVVSFTHSEIPDRAVLNANITLPESVTASYNSKSVTASNGVVVRPDGKIIDASDLTKLDQSGVYTVKYFFKEGKVIHTALKEITVYSSYYGFSAGSSDIKLSSSSDQLWSKKDGVIIDLKDGDTFTYNKPVNLKAAGEDGLTEVIEIDGRLGSMVNGSYVANAEAIWVRLTDCYNPNVYAELRIGKSPDYTGSYFPGVRTTNQTCTGLEKGSTHSATKQVVIDGVQYGFWYQYGYMSGFNTMAEYDTMTTGYIWKYDYEKMRFYFCYNGGDDVLVTDLDEPILFPDGNFFPGWTTGEVYVSVYGDNYLSGNVARTEIVSIGGESVYDKENNFDILSGEYTDQVAPVITVNAKKTTATGIYGAVGDTITVPEATATDVNLIGDVEVAVFTGYGTSSISNVSVTNGKFKIESKDTYTIVYTARDSSGNVGTAIYTIAAKNVEGNRAVALTYDKFSSLTTGEPVLLTYKIKDSVNCPVSDVKVKIHVESARQTADFDGEGTFIPSYAEDYRITYSYTDGIYSYDSSYRVTSSVSGSVVTFDGEAVLPQTFISGYYYSLPVPQAYGYANGYPEEIEVKTYAVYNGDTSTKTLIEDTDRAQIENKNNVYFVFEAKGAQPVTTETVSIINVGGSSNIDASKLFTGNFSVDKSSLKFTSKASSGNNKLSFVNAVSARYFALTYKVLADEANFETLRITFTDYADSSIKNVIDINNGGKKSTASINGGTASELAEFTFGSDIYIPITYSYASRKLTIGYNTFSLDANYPSGKCYLSMEMIGMSGTSVIEIGSINNQIFSRTISVDNATPEIYAYNFGGEYAVGSVVKTAIPEFADVLSGVDYSSVSVTIKANDGKPVKDEDGNELTTLDYTKQYGIKLDRVTKFFVSYSVRDFEGNTAYINVTVNCIDTTGPVITLTNMKEGGTIHVKPTDTIKIYFTVSDDFTAAGNVLTYIHLHCDDMYSFVPNVTGITEDNRPIDGVYQAEFNINIKGNYTAQIHCYDEKFNHSVIKIKIVVE